eukprot:TRINITY_DN15768_c0_g1_i2.p1 TRINITY_DN15768_c0_g1~~TRINITY_DN15768_c0_g1_i2.p1  ORF type:complete len:419 (+),score=111.14 TRINITY_DN15768_c0_g1_i2:220-1476(+)
MSHHPGAGCPNCSAPAAAAGAEALAGPGVKDELKALGVECVRVVVGLAATVLATKLVWHFVNPWKHEEQKNEAKRKGAENKLGDLLDGITTDAYENQIASNCVVRHEDLNVRFSDVAGLAQVKQRLMEAVILPFTREDLFPLNSLSGPPKGVLLYGPPGTGKTMLAKAVACETRATFFNVEISELQSQWFGESQHLVKALFTLARKVEPSIIFIDEIDSLGRTRRDDDHQVVSDMRAELMSCWDGFSSDSTRVMVLGTTNRLWAIDPAIQRRLPRQFEIPIPDLEHRRQIAQKVLANESLDPGFDFDAVAAGTAGYSGSDLKELGCAAVNGPIRDYLAAASLVASEEGLQLRALTTEDVLEARDSVRPPVENLDQYRSRYGDDAPGVAAAVGEQPRDSDFDSALRDLVDQLGYQQGNQ